MRLPPSSSPDPSSLPQRLCGDALGRDARDLEREADALLAGAGRDPERPAYSEPEMRRKRARWNPLDDAGDLPAPPTGDDLHELTFLAGVSDLTHEQGVALRLWSQGLSVPEIARAVCARERVVHRWLRQALLACYFSMDVSFRRMSQVTVYRPPKRRADHDWPARCPHCAAPIRDPEAAPCRCRR